MQIFLDCLPCFLRQTLEASRIATNDEKMQIKIMDEVIKLLTDFKNYKSSPELASDIHEIIKKHTGINDLYKEVKKRDIASALELYPLLEEFIKKNDAVKTALKISALGNNIDVAVYSNLNVKDCIKNELENDFSLCDLEIFEEKLKTAKTLLIIGDNSGETVFDKLLIKKLNLKTYYTVRNQAILNDATKEDAIESGLDEVSEIISSGCNCPGLVLERCSDEFLTKFYSADIVISKGQGNFEAMNTINRGVFFLLKAKCQMVSKELNTSLNGYVFKYIEK
jgi:hypothetical protein